MTANDSKPERYGEVTAGGEFFDRRMSEQRYAAMNFSDGTTKKRFPWGEGFRAGAVAQGGRAPPMGLGRGACWK